LDSDPCILGDWLISDPFVSPWIRMQNPTPTISMLHCDGIGSLKTLNAVLNTSFTYTEGFG
jgi:hypothetical protein